MAGRCWALLGAASPCTSRRGFFSTRYFGGDGETPKRSTVAGGVGHAVGTAERRPRSSGAVGAVEREGGGWQTGSRRNSGTLERKNKNRVDQRNGRKRVAVRSPQLPEKYVVDSTSTDPHLSGPIEMILTDRGCKLRWHGSRENWQEFEWFELLVISGQYGGYQNSMSDLFHEDVRTVWINQIFGVMAACPQHTFQILTKRPEQMLSWITTVEQEVPREGCYPWLINWPGRDGEPVTSQWPLKNVWLGVSVEDQKTADERIPLLLQTPAAVRWVSYEPALGPVDFTRLNLGDQRTGWGMRRIERDSLSPWETQFHKPGDPKSKTANQDNVNRGAKLDWIVAGGESGPGARPSHPDWFRAVRDQCAAAGVAFFFKQWGEWIAPSQIQKGMTIGMRGQEDQFGCFRVGKKTAGRLLDGHEWNEFPNSHNAVNV